MNRTIIGDCRDTMRELIAQGVKVQTCVTSPPYWGLRDYGTAQWEGGDPLCEHKGSIQRTAPAGTAKQASNVGAVAVASGDCACGARRIDRQIGLESSPQEYVEKMVEVFRLVRDLLADDGTLWLNLGDSYANDGKWGGETGGKQAYLDDNNRKRVGREKRFTGLKAKDLVGIPWRVAFALQADGWYLRQDIIWAKPNPMPESVRDRCTKSHEYLFLLAKRERYYYDAEAIAEPSTAESMARFTRNSYPNEARAKACVQGPSARDRGDGSLKMDETRNKRSVWTVTTQPYSEAHFATFPPELIKPCILAGSRPGDVVFDPFMGSGTTAQVALELGRQYLGCELNPEYARLCDDRTKVTIGLPLSPQSPIPDPVL